MTPSIRKGRCSSRRSAGLDIPGYCRSCEQCAPVARGGQQAGQGAEKSAEGTLGLHCRLMGYQPPVEANEGPSAMRLRTGRFEAGAGARRHLKPGGLVHVARRRSAAERSESAVRQSEAQGTQPWPGSPAQPARGHGRRAGCARARLPVRTRLVRTSLALGRAKSEALATLARANSSSVISGRCNGRTLDRADRDRRSGDARRKRWGAYPTGASLRRSRCP